MQLENLISIAAIMVTLVVVLARYVSSINKRLTVMEERLKNGETKFTAIDLRIDEVERDNEKTRQEVAAIKVSMARIEVFVEMSTDLMKRVDSHLQNQQK